MHGVWWERFRASFFVYLLASSTMVFMIAELMFIVRSYWNSGSFKECQKEFKKKFPGREPPTKPTISKLETTGSIVDTHSGGRPAMSENTVQCVKKRLLQSPKKSLRRLSQETGLSYSTCQKAAKMGKLKPYLVTVFHELLPIDMPKRMHYCRWFKEFVGQNPGVLDITWFTDEAWFHLSGYVNLQNTRIWASENPHVIHKERMHPIKIGVWCAISLNWIISPIFFEQTINTEVYLNIFTQFVNQLDDIELQNGLFQWDSATCHTSNASVAEIRSFFSDRVISKGLWPPRSPDLTPPDYFLWGHLKCTLYSNKPRTIQQLKNIITQKIEAIKTNMLRRTFDNRQRRVDLCLDANGGHFQHLL